MFRVHASHRLTLPRGSAAPRGNETGAPCPRRAERNAFGVLEEQRCASLACHAASIDSWRPRRSSEPQPEPDPRLPAPAKPVGVRATEPPRSGGRSRRTQDACRPTFQVTLLLVLAGCHGAPGAPVDAGRDSPARDAPPPPPLLDPATYDCRATAPPARRSTVRLDCAIDPACTERLVSSHRGAGAPGALAPENTLSAMRAAIAAGADMVEMDVRPTSDGTLVLMHDADVDRTTDGTGPVSAMTLAEVQALGIDASLYAVGDFSCDRVPTFAEALALADGRVVIVVDASKTDRIDLIVGAIQTAGAIDRVIFDSTDPADTEAALAIEPTLNVLLRATDEATLDAVLVQFAAHPPVYVHIEDADRTVVAPLVMAAGHRVFALGFIADLLVEGDPTAYEPLFADGIQMIQSNRPELLSASLGRLP